MKTSLPIFVSTLLLALLLMLNSTSMAQFNHPEKSDSNSFVTNSPKAFLGPVAAMRGFQNYNVEIGIHMAISSHGMVGSELSYVRTLANQRTVNGIGLGVYKAFALFETGINATVLMENLNRRAYLRPYFGLGIGGIVTLSYGYQLNIGENPFEEVMNAHSFRLVIRPGFALN